MKIDDIKKRVDELINMAGLVLKSRRGTDFGEFVSSESFNEFRSASLSFLRNTFGVEHPFYKEFYENSKNARPSITEIGRGILKAAKQEIDGGWIFTVKGLISVEVFTDYIEMAEHLLTEGYKDPSAVLIGSTLEAHLRELSKTNGIDMEVKNTKGNLVPKRADLLNSDLTKAGIYSSAYHKQIIAWLSIRNSAAHGQYSEYTNEEIKLMLQGIRQFMLTTK